MTKPTYPHNTTWTVERNGEEIDVTVEYAVDDYATPASGHFGLPEDYDPGSGWAFAINPVAAHEDGSAMALTQAEIDAIHDWLCENHEEDDYHGR